VCCSRCRSRRSHKSNCGQRWWGSATAHDGGGDPGVRGGTRQSAGCVLLHLGRLWCCLRRRRPLLHHPSVHQQRCLVGRCRSRCSHKSGRGHRVLCFLRTVLLKASPPCWEEFAKHIQSHLLGRKRKTEQSGENGPRKEAQDTFSHAFDVVYLFRRPSS
jgi:hypothetical protein